MSYTFKVDNEANADGTSLVGEIKGFSYKEMVKALGEPGEGDGYKVSGEWLFTGDDEEVFTVYDWKCTSLYDSSDMTVRQWRNSGNKYDFHVGGNTDPKRFIAWLTEKVKGA